MNKYDIITNFLLTGNFIESENNIIKGPIMSLSDYLIYHINILQDINLFDTIDYQNLLMTIKDNINELKTIFFIFNQVEYYKLFELNNILKNYIDNNPYIHNNYNFNSINKDGFYFDFKEIFENFNNYRENNEINYSKLIYFSNKNYYSNILNYQNNKDNLINEELNIIKNGETTYHITNLNKNLIIRKTDFILNNIIYLESNFNINLIFNSYLSLFFNNVKFYNNNDVNNYKLSYINNDYIKSFKIKSKTNLCIGIDLNTNKNIYRFYLTVNDINNDNLNNINLFKNFKTSYKDTILDNLYINVIYNNYCIINKKQIINRNKILFSKIQEYVYETDKNNSQIKKLIKNIYNNFDINFQLTDINNINLLNKYNNIIYYNNNFNIINYDKKYINIKTKNNINKIIFKDNIFYNFDKCNFKIEDIIFSKKC